MRAFNVLRQYPVEAVPDAWSVMRAALAPGGLIVDGTCDELGRRCCWVLLDADGPISLTLACDPFAIERPSDLAERLPKVLIHHNVAGQPIHTLLTAADRAWASVAGHGVFGPRVRWRAMLDLLRDEGFPSRAAAPPHARRRAFRAVVDGGAAASLSTMRIALAQIQSGAEPRPTSAWSRSTRAAPPTPAPAWCCSRRRRCAGSGCRSRRSPNRLTGHGRRPCARSPSARASSSSQACSSPPGTTAGRVTNTLIATGPGVDTHYDKIHLYDAFGFTESDTDRAGARTRRHQRRRRLGTG